MVVKKLTNTLFLVIAVIACCSCSKSVNSEEIMSNHLNRNIKLFDYLKEKGKVSFLLDSIEDRFGTQFNYIGEVPSFEHKESLNSITFKTYLYLRSDSIMQINMLVQSEDKGQFKTITKLYESVENICKQFELYNDSLIEGYIVNHNFIQLLPFEGDDISIGFGISVQRFMPDVWKKEREEQKRIEEEFNKSENSLDRKLRLNRQWIPSNT